MTLIQNEFEIMVVHNKRRRRKDRIRETILARINGINKNIQILDY